MTDHDDDPRYDRPEPERSERPERHARTERPDDTPPAWPRVPNPSRPGGVQGVQYTEPIHRTGPPQPGPAAAGPGYTPPPGYPPARTPGPWPHGTGPQAAGGANASYADAIRRDDLIRTRQPEPRRGWRRLLLRATFGLVNLGPSAAELQEEELEKRIKAALSGHYKVGVMGKGGVGKTTVSASIGSVFAELRQDDRVVAIDADTAFGKLGSRVDPKALGSYWELAADQHLDTFADIRNRVGNNAAGLFVLAGEASPARRRVLDPAVYREAATRLDRHFTISIVDCSSTMDSPVTQEVLRDLDALIVVSSPWVDGAGAAGQTLDWLAARGLKGLLQRTVVVLNDSDGHADKRTRAILAQQFSGQGQAVVEVPFDDRLRTGAVIDRTAEMAPATRRKFVEIAAALASNFPKSDDRHRERFRPQEDQPPRYEPR
ncbi:MinD/ParA family protein [Mycobacterium sp. OTB74]|uniref:MinD/ParA family ATP-binding protein n=1 Tax=Mycobacterium sp. OTB74 TaxID=1853452 RepID=UPI002472EE8B|nr:MinD/ParA family protein [Mycobacterium sp. OTB74]MDH6244340.1 MinD-like ATPase involved in chromosome partitioning or flagellar assembly [Mycobacterium sp. OTB74]